MIVKKIMYLLIGIQLSLLCSASFGGQYDILTYNEEYFSSDSCETFDLNNESCFSMPTNSSRMRYVSEQVVNEVKRRLPEQYNIRNSNHGGSKAENLTNARETGDGLYLGLRAYPIKMGDHWRITLNGEMIGIHSGRSYASDRVVFDLPASANCDDSAAEFGFSDECFNRFYQQASSSLAFSLTTKMGINNLDEQVHFTDLNAMVASVGNAPGENEFGTGVIDQGRNGRDLKSYEVTTDSVSHESGHAQSVSE